MKIKLPIKTLSEANNNEHWAKRNKRHQEQKKAILLNLTPEIKGYALPCKIKLTRIAPRKMDAHDNLPMAFKYIFDALAEILIPGKAIGQADNDKRIAVTYDQIRGGVGEYAIEIEITPG